MQVAHLHTVVAQVIGELFGHALGQRRDQNTLVLFNSDADLLQHIIDLVGGGPDFHNGVHQARGPNQLFNHLARMCLFIISRCCGDKDHLAHPLFKLLQFQWPVVQRTGQSEAVLHQGGFSCAVAVVHAPKLPHQDVTFIKKHECIFGQIIGECAWGLAGFSPREVSGVVLNAFAVPNLTEHFQIKPRSLLNALRLHEFAVSKELFDPLIQLHLDGLNSCKHPVSRGHIMT